MMNIHEVPQDILQDLRKRGLSDLYISEMTAEEAFDEFCMWHGLIEWGPILRRAMTALKEAETEER